MIRPEEHIRQTLIHKMIHEFEYPKNLIVTEKSLHSLPHISRLEKKKVPNRRLDILVYAKGIHQDFGLYPLLIIECKAKDITQKAMEQAVGYNEVVRAPFVAIAGREGIWTGQYQNGMFKFREGFYSFQMLLSVVKGSLV